jgi:hypothetical protein
VRHDDPCCSWHGKRVTAPAAVKVLAQTWGQLIVESEMRCDVDTPTACWPGEDHNVKLHSAPVRWGAQNVLPVEQQRLLPVVLAGLGLSAVCVGDGTEHTGRGTGGVLQGGAARSVEVACDP